MILSPIHAETIRNANSDTVSTTATKVAELSVVHTERARVHIAKRIYAQRRHRERAFESFAAVFRDPAWDMTLALYIASEEHRRVSASSAALASNTPMTTGLRFVDRLVDAGVVERADDPGDARRSLVKLTPAARVCMEVYLDRVASNNM